MKSEYINVTLNERMVRQYASTHTEYYSCAGYYKKAASHHVVRKHQDFYLMMLCVEGCGTLCIDGNSFEIHKGDCMLCYSGVPVSYTSSKAQPWSLYWIHFDLKENSPLFTFIQSLVITTKKPVMAVQNKLPLTELFEKIIDFNDTLPNDLQFCLQQNTFLTLLYTGLSVYVQKSIPNKYVATAIKYIGNNIGQKITINELASQVHLSRYYLAHLFQQSMNVSPAQYIIEERIRYGKALLVSSSLTISEIASKTGFDNAMYFSNTFKKHTGFSPKDYRICFLE
jgi:AraC family transcriptional regulator of arabinose operon